MELNNRHDLSSSIKKLVLSSLRPTAAIHPALLTPLKASQPVLEPSLWIVSELSDNTAEDVYVDVHELARHGKEGFIAKLRLQHLGTGSGIRRNLLWDVAELSATADGIADLISEGEGGVYALQSRSSGWKLALSKPTEEEKFVRGGLYVDEGAVREEEPYCSIFAAIVCRQQQWLYCNGASKTRCVQRFMASFVGSMESFGMPFDLEKAREFVSVEQMRHIALLDAIRTDTSNIPFHC
ncbi:unnamed protein product [Peronospora destructor]|uniref:Uncharacterized protein n=1 Tax=Peronospora destructor TaxID=86335 RepID=A0AAV0UJH1_9STRA|nr:unnamed protein product [Peronospora destructor]